MPPGRLPESPQALGLRESRSGGPSWPQGRSRRNVDRSALAYTWQRFEHKERRPRRIPGSLAEQLSRGSLWHDCHRLVSAVVALKVERQLAEEAAAGRCYAT